MIIYTPSNDVFLFHQINTNGILSMGRSFTQYLPHFFPVGSRYLVAPFWDDINTEAHGDISYLVYTTGSSLLDTVNTIISDEENTNFIGHWMLVAEWDSVAELGGRFDKVSAIL